MRARYYVAGLLIAGLFVLMISGCSSFMNVNERAMHYEDVINMTKAGVGPDVIKRQIAVTRSRFELSADQIIQLKKAGVDDKVIEAMIETEELPDYYQWEYGNTPYEYWTNYYNQWYPVYHYYPQGYPSYNYYPYVYPYTVYRQSNLIGRFYRYMPLNPPQWDYGRQGWIQPEERELNQEKEEK